jgi:ABC-type antimicrobial peptide transport system permease subunit
MKTREMTYLLVLCGFCLIGAATLAAVHKAAVLRQDKKALEALFWLGMNNRDASRLFALHGLVISAVGAAIGVLVGLALPSFLTAALEDNSVFLLSPPLISVLASLVICLAGGVVPASAWMRRLPLT